MAHKITTELTKKFASKIRTLEDKQNDNIGVNAFIPTNNIAIDYIIGRRGLPSGRISHIYGKSGSGKSSLVASIIGAAQAKGIECALIDAENSYDASWSRRFNVDPDSLVLGEPDSLEESFDMTRDIISQFSTGITSPTLVVYDSISALPSTSELEQEDSSSSQAQGIHARIISRELRKTGPLVKNKNVCLLFVSQLRDNPRASWGNTESILGGNALKFHAGLWIKLAAIKTLKVKEEAIGFTIQAQTTKNKFTRPYKVHTFNLYYDTGFNPKEILLDFACEAGLVKSTTGWYEIDGNKYRKEEAAEKLDDSLTETIYQHLGL